MGVVGTSKVRTEWVGSLGPISVEGFDRASDHRWAPRLRLAVRECAAEGVWGSSRLLRLNNRSWSLAAQLKFALRRDGKSVEAKLILADC